MLTETATGRQLLDGAAGTAPDIRTILPGNEMAHAGVNSLSITADI